MPSTLVALHGVLFTLMWRRIVRLSSAISLTGAPAICRKRFVRRAKAPWTRRIVEGIGWQWGRLLQPRPSLCCWASFLDFVVYIFLCHPSHLVSTGDVNHPPLLFSTSNALGICSFLAWLDSTRLYFGLPKLPDELELLVFQVPTSSMERGSMFNEWARFTQESTLDYAPPAANPSHY